MCSWLRMGTCLTWKRNESVGSREQDPIRSLIPKDTGLTLRITKTHFWISCRRNAEVRPRRAPLRLVAVEFDGADTLWLASLIVLLRGGEMKKGNRLGL